MVVGLTAFVASPIVAYLNSGSWSLAGAVVYFIQHATVLLDFGWVPWPTADFDTRVLVAAPLPAWNGSLWTLFYESWAYIAVALLTSIRLFRERPFMPSAATFLVLAVLQPLANGPLGVSTHLYLHIMRLWSYFFAGMAIYSISDRIKPSRNIALASLCCTGIILVFAANPWWYVQIPYTLLLLSAGAVLPTRAFARNDLSYGMYIYAFPVQQILALSLGAGTNWYLGAGLCFLLTTCMAALSWFCVEKPALAAKNLVPAKRTSRVEVK